METALYGSEAYSNLASRVMSSVHDHLAHFCREPQHASFSHMLALLLAVEPIVYPLISGVVSVGPSEGESFDGYLMWREELDAKCLLATSSLNLDEAKEWHERLSIQADLHDPLEHFAFSYDR